MIDFVLMRHPQRRYCTDVSVVRSANCFTDHHMVRARMRLDFPRRHHRTPGTTRRPIAVQHLRDDDTRRQFHCDISASTSAAWFSECG